MIIVCSACGMGLRVQGDPEEILYLLGEKSDFWPDKYPCPTCAAKCKAFLECEIDTPALALMTMIDLTPQEAYAALFGLGLPEERSCCAEVVEALFKEHGIVAKGRQHHGVLRYYLDELTLKDGTRFFLAPSPYGAVIYRVSKPHSYTKEMTDGSDHPVP